MDADVVAAMALLLTPGIGATTVARALSAARAAGKPLVELMAMPPRRIIDLLPAGADHIAAAIARCEPRNRARARALLKHVHQSGARAVLITDSAYPRTLAECLEAKAPPFLFAQGDFALLQEAAAAIVGARAPSPAGARLAAACAASFARAGVTVVSGAAQGVDTAAHYSALEHGGKMILVLPQGLLTYLVPGEVRKATDSGHALVLSEFLPDAPWATHAAVTRNATISALARMVCVIEPKKTGGSVRTARCALGQGKRVLIHPARNAASIAHTLRNAGALPIVEPGAAFNPERLLEIWRATPRALPRQADLI